MIMNAELGCLNAGRTPYGTIDVHISRHVDSDILLHNHLSQVNLIIQSRIMSQPTVWCATAKGLEGKGGLYCEDCGEAEPAAVVDGQRVRTVGYVPWSIGDHETEARLWEISEQLVASSGN